MSEETKYITKIIKEEEAITGDGEKVGVEIEYLIKDSEARVSISDLERDVFDINQTLGDFSTQDNFESVKAEISGINNKIGNLEEITNKPTGNNTVVNNINNLGKNINDLEDTITEYIDSEINEINSKIGDLEDITSKPKDNTIVNNINGLGESIGEVYLYLGNNLKPELEGKITAVSENLEATAQAIVGEINYLGENTIGYLRDIEDADGTTKSIVYNINRLDTRINDVVDNVSDELSNKISGIIIDSTDIAHVPDEEGIVNLNGDITLASINITYDELVRRRDGGALVPGQKYRITDYVTGVGSREGVYKSDFRQFDIIAEALTNKTLSEDAKACHHEFENPEDDYFINSNLSAWELKYCLDNDFNRFNWIPVDGESVNSLEIHINSNLTSNITNLLRDDLIPTGYLVINQYTTDTENYSTNPAVLVSYSLEISPCGYEDQLCLHPELSNHGPNPNIAYFYYGDYDLDEANDFMIDGSYWRKAYRESEDGAWKWSFASNGEEYLGALFIITEKNVIDRELSSTFSFSLEKLRQDNTKKGVIYCMKDEWGNEAPFDFKNIRTNSLISIRHNSSSVFDIDQLYSQPSPNSVTPIAINSLNGWWYLFSGLKCYVGQNGFFLSSSEDILLSKTAYVNDSTIIDTTMYNNNPKMSKNTVITAQNIVKPNCGDINSNYCYEIPRNIFLSLIPRTISEDSNISRTKCNIIEFSGTENIFISGPVSSTLGNVLSTFCKNNKFYKGVMYKSLPPSTMLQTYVQGLSI